MKRFLTILLCLLCPAAWAVLDLTKPADDGYLASAPAEIRANQTAIVASITPPIEWVSPSTGGTYGSAAVRLGDNAQVPWFWLGSVLPNSKQGVSVFTFSSGLEPPSAWDATTSYRLGIWHNPESDFFNQITLNIPQYSVNEMATNAIELTDIGLAMGDRKLMTVATGTVVTDAVNLGQMNAAISASVDVLVVANMVASTPADGGTVARIPNGGGTFPATFTFEVIDTHGAWDGETFTAPVDGLYDVYVQLSVYRTGTTPGECSLAAVETLASGSYSAPYLLAKVRMDDSELYSIQTLAGRIVIPMQANDTFYINQAASAVDFYYELRNSTLMIRRIADLP